MASNEIKRKHLDSRTSDRYLKKGIVSQKDFDAHVKALPDDEANATFVQMDLHDTGFASDESDEDEEDDDTSNNEE
jgi:hypothetical protein